MSTAIKQRLLFSAIVLLNLSAVFGSAWAAEDPVIEVRGGQTSCGKWLTEREQKSWTAISQEAWLVGYLSGIAYQSRIDLLRGADSLALTHWVDGYCREAPLDTLMEAANALRKELARKAASRARATAK